MTNVLKPGSTWDTPTATPSPQSDGDWLVASSLAPNTSGYLAPFYEAAQNQRIAFPFCGVCPAFALEFEQTTCDQCGASIVVWREVDRSGIVHAATTVHRLEPGLIVGNDPYHVIDVEFPSGHRLLMTTCAPTESAPAIGSTVKIGFRAVGEVLVPAVESFTPFIPAGTQMKQPDQQTGGTP
jgi:uncharacterized protein